MKHITTIMVTAIGFGTGILVGQYLRKKASHRDYIFIYGGQEAPVCETL